jgi:hypothetical protein
MVMGVAGTRIHGVALQPSGREISEAVMRVLRCAALGCAVALTAASATAQNVITRHIDNEPVETTVTQTPAGTVITRRPIAPAAVPAAPMATPVYDYGAYGTIAPRPYVAPAPVYRPPAAAAVTTELDEMVGVAPTEVRRVTVRRPAETSASERTTTRTTRVTHRVRETTGSASSVHREPRRVSHRVASRPLVLTPAQRNVVYRTVVQQQVVPAVPVAPVGYPPFPAPAYQPRTVVVAPSATTGYGFTTADLDEDYVDTMPAVTPYPRYTAARYAVGSVLPASVVVTPLPSVAAARVPAVQPYSYATIGGRVLLVDPVTNAVVADITP